MEDFTYVRKNSNLKADAHELQCRNISKRALRVALHLCNLIDGFEFRRTREKSFVIFISNYSQAFISRS